MSSTTNNLGLIKPTLTDEIHQTVSDIATSFQKIDDAADLYADNVPTSGSWTKKQRVWNNNPTSGSYVGWVVVRSGQATQKWASIRPYTIGDLIMPLNDNGHIYECIQSGTSGVTLPTLPVTTDGTVEDHNGATSWQAATSYAANSIVLPGVPNGFFYVAETAGNSGSTEPLWSATEGDANLDNGITWRTYRIAIWQEAGTSVMFKGFGIIE